MKGYHLTYCLGLIHNPREMLSKKVKARNEREAFAAIHKMHEGIPVFFFSINEIYIDT